MHGSHRHPHGHARAHSHDHHDHSHESHDARAQSTPLDAPASARLGPGFRRDDELGVGAGQTEDRHPGEGRGPGNGSRERHAHARNHHPGPGHNVPETDLHSHLAGHDERNRYRELQALATAFIDAFQKADDKTSYLRLAGIPVSLPGPDGLEQYLVDVSITAEFQVATASPGFGSRELVHLPFPGSMVRERTRMTFAYVSLTGRRDVDLLDVLDARFPVEPSSGPGR